MFGTSALLKESLGTKQQLSTPRLALIACWFVFRKSSRASHESQTVTTTQPRSRLVVILLLSRDLSSLRRYFYRVWAPTTHSHTALQSQACRTTLHVIVGIRMLLVLHQLLMTSKCDTVVSVFDGSGSEKGVITLAWPPLFQVFLWMNERNYRNMMLDYECHGYAYDYHGYNNNNNYVSYTNKMIQLKII